MDDEFKVKNIVYNVLITEFSSDDKYVITEHISGRGRGLGMGRGSGLNMKNGDEGKNERVASGHLQHLLLVKTVKYKVELFDMKRALY